MRILIRAALWPVKVALMLLEWAVLFVTHFVGIGCYLLSRGCFVLAVAGWLTGLVSGAETVHTLGIGFVFFATPLIGEKIVCTFSNIRRLARDCLD